MRHLHAPRLFTVAALVACATLITPIVAPRPAAAQDASNVVPDGGAGAMSGTIRSIDFQTREVVVTPRAGGRPHTFHAPPHVNIAGYMAGVDVNVHFTRTVNIRVTPATPGSAAPTAPGATTTVGQVLGPAGFGDGAAEVVASVVRVNPPNEVIVANATGGGE